MLETRGSLIVESYRRQHELCAQVSGNIVGPGLQLARNQRILHTLAACLLM